MHTTTPRISTLIASLLLSAPALPALGQGTPIGFEEDFALATDRAAALEDLITGTPDYYYYHCLHLQHEGRFAEVVALLKTWATRHGRGSRMRQIENRQALLTFESDPAQGFSLLREQLGLRFDHQRELPGEKPDLPTRLDPELISAAALTARALAKHRGAVTGFQTRALESLVVADLDERGLTSLLKRLQRPDVPNLPALVVRDLERKSSRGFGSRGIHSELLLGQLDECVALRPALLSEVEFVRVYTTRLAPSSDVEVRYDAEAREAYLGRLQAFARRLPPAHNSFKAHVLHHRLAHDLALGKPDKERFLAYLRLPRQAAYTNPEYHERSVSKAEIADLAVDFDTQFAAVGDDEALVRAYLGHFFRSEDSFEPYAAYVREDYLRPLFAEIKILAGIGDMERWYSLLDDPRYYEALKQRVEIEFRPTQRTYFGAQEPVAIGVELKNVDTLLVKVFEINTLNYHTAKEREVDEAIRLDGLVPNEERTYTYDVNPLRRVYREFDFPELSGRGVYVVEFVGNGMSSRAVIRKERLQYLERPGSAGHVFRVLDEAGVHVREASIRMGGREYLADEHGEILLPYSTSPGRQTILLCDGSFSTLEDFLHASEGYKLEAAVALDRESLLAHGTALLVVRPSLRVNRHRASVALLEDATLTIVARDRRGVLSTQVVSPFQLYDDRESVHEIQVPEGLRSLTATVHGRVLSMSKGEHVSLASTRREFTLNGIDETEWTACPLLSRTAAGYVLEVLGKNGEPQLDRAVELSFEHEDYKDPVLVTLKTDAAGRIELGALDGIRTVQAAGLPDGLSGWRLRPAACAYPRRLQGSAGETLRVPYQGTAQSTTRSVASLLELREGYFAHDRFDHVRLAAGFVELHDLAPGDYDLWLKEADRHITVRVTDGPARAGFGLGRDRLLELQQGPPLHITDLRVDGDEVVLRVENARPDTRVLVSCTRYVAAYDPFAAMSVPAAPDPHRWMVQHGDSSYHSGREIGGEYRYILERRFARKFPGNMLSRPGLLLNPWALDETNTMIGLGGGAGGAFGGRFGGKRNLRAAGGSGSEQVVGTAPGTFPNLEFLPGPSRVLANLRPDADGVLRVPLSELSGLSGGQLVHAVAVDADSTVYASLPLPARALQPRDRRLQRALDPDRHLTEQRRIEFVPAGTSVTISDVATSSAEAYDSLESVFDLYRTLSGNSDLDRFSFLLEWPELELARKLELYSDHACHELHFFVHQKDPDFFTDVVRPYLASKAHKTFLDRWLLEEDLSSFLDPWAFARLNVVERILLARRISARSGDVRRHVEELFELRPPSLELEERYFRTALAGLALDAQDTLGDQLKAVTAKPPAPTGPSTPGPRTGADKKSKRPAAAAVPEEEEEVVAEEPSAEEDGVPRDREQPDDVSEDLLRRDAARPLYRAPADTKAYVEHNYWHRRIEEQDGDLISVNAFWRDYAGSAELEPFFSTHFPAATGSFAEMLLALAVLDLPFRSAEHETERVDDRMTLRASNPLLLVRRELEPAQVTEDRASVLIGQNLYRVDDRYTYDAGVRRDKFVSGEFLAGVAYGCQVVVTNPTSTPRKLDLLVQIPAGAIPVSGSVATRGVTREVGAYGTSTFEYSFYFPAPGRYEHYPVHAGQDGELLAFAAAAPLDVVAELGRVDTTSWEHVSQSGSTDELLAYLGTVNLLRLDLSKIAWRMRERAVFDAVLERLRGRLVYDDLLWSYGLYHAERSATREYLSHATGFVARCGRYLDTPLLRIDPIERRSYQHVEFSPLFNARAHPFGPGREILDRDLARQYTSLLRILAHRPRLDDVDWMSVTYYLLTQDRIEDALESFARVDAARLPLRLQYDYMRAYLDFYSDDHALARGIAERYQDYPVPHWRGLFQEVVAQLDEAVGGAAAGGEPGTLDQQQALLAAAEPALDLEVGGRQVTLAYQNLEHCEVNYYRMDVEFLFSTSPFVQHGSSAFSYIRPGRSDPVALGARSGEVSFALPDEFQSSNVLVEVRAGGIAKRRAHYANDLSVHVSEGYGQLRVLHAETQRPLPRVYVKVFARMPGGAERFHKDGYTDLRGRFDYTSVSGPGNHGAERFAILVLSEKDGAVIREVDPPLR